MNYNLLDEDENKFVVGNADSSFSVAKYGLDDGFMAKLRSLPKIKNYDNAGRMGFADGGVVEDPSLIAQDEGEFSVTNPMGGVLTVPKDFSDPATMELYNKAAAQAELGVEPSLEQKRMMATPQPVAPTAPAVLERPLEQPGVAQPTGAPSSGDATPAYLKMMQEMAAGGQPASFAMPPEIMSGYEKMQQGTLAQAKAHADAAMEQARLYDEQAKDLQLQEIARQTQMRRLDQETSGLQKDVANQKIDPNRIWSNATTGNRVTAGISLLLGGLSQGLSGAKTNPAMDVINNAIDRDIDAQKAELGKKQNLLSLNLAKYGRLDQAFQATKMQIMAVTQAQINQQAAKMGSKQALAAAQVATGQMDVQLATLKNQLASQFAASQKIQDPKGMTFDDLMKMDEKMREVMVPISPTAGNQFKNRFIPAVSKEDATKIKTAYTLYQQTAPLLQRVRVAMDKGLTLPKTAQNDIANALKSELILLQKNIQQLGQITEADMDLVNPLIPQVGKLFDKGERAKLDLLMKRNDELIDAAYMGKTGYNRAAYKGAEKPVFGGR